MTPIPHHQTFLAVPSGVDRRLVLRCPPRGMLDQIQVTQTSGTPAGFSYAVYNSSDAFNADDTLAPDAASHIVLPRVDVASGTSSVDPRLTVGLRLHYANLDPHDADRPRLAYRRHLLHLWIKVEGSGAKDFAVSNCVVTDSN
jgi:hypothetical protein